MAFLNLQSPITPGQPSNKKTILIAGASIFGIAIIAALIAGIFAPATAPQPSNSQSNTGTNASDIGMSPMPTDGSTINPTTVTPKSATKPSPSPQYGYEPEPTLDFDALLPTKPITPTPTPLPGPFFTANGKQNDLTLWHYKRNDWDSLLEMQLINKKTREVRLLGYSYEAAPGDSRFFSPDFSQVIFLGGSKTDYQKITIYSIPLKKVIKEIRLAEIKQRLPALQLQTTATLSRMVLSPDSRKIALSYGNTFNETVIDAATNIIAIDLATRKMQLLPVRGLVRGWKDNTTLEYELNSANPNANTVQEVKVTGL